jgi:DNA-binding SARP family transcriptional activator
MNSGHLSLCLFGGFSLRWDDAGLVLPLQVQRLVALVAVRRSVRREEASGTLWPEAPRARAAARLRSVLWRLGRSGQGVVASSNGQLQLADDVDLDLSNWLEVALRILDRPEAVAGVDLATVRARGELLPGWYDDWLLLERERIRQLQLHVLEAVAEHRLGTGSYAGALEFALRALGMDETRESAHRLVIRIHLAEGNTGEARRQVAHCERVLSEELGVRPTRQLLDLLTTDGPVPGQRPPSSGVPGTDRLQDAPVERS